MYCQQCHTLQLMVNEKHEQVPMLEAIELFHLLNTWQTGLTLPVITSALSELVAEYGNFRKECDTMSDVITLLHVIAKLNRHVEAEFASPDSMMKLSDEMTSAEVTELRASMAHTSVMLLKQIITDILCDDCKLLYNADVEKVLDDVTCLWHPSMRVAHGDDLLRLTSFYMSTSKSDHLLSRLRLALCLHENSLFHEELAVTTMRDLVKQANEQMDCLLKIIDPVTLLSFVGIVCEFPAASVPSEWSKMSDILDACRKDLSETPTTAKYGW